MRILLASSQALKYFYIGKIIKSRNQELNLAVRRVVHAENSLCHELRDFD